MSGTRCHRIGLCVAVLLLAAGCTNGSDADRERADQAEAQVAALQADLADAQSEAATTASTIADFESALAAAQADLRDTQMMLRSTRQTLDQLQSESFSLLDSQAALHEQYELGQATLGRLVDAICEGVDTELPASLPESLVSWLKQTQSISGEVPDDLGITFMDAVGRDAWWVFTAEFNSRFQPGVFLRDADGGFQILWGGFASTEVELWAYLLQESPGGPAGLVTCIDLSPFIDS